MIRYIYAVLLILMTKVGLADVILLGNTEAHPVSDTFKDAPILLGILLACLLMLSPVLFLLWKKRKRGK